MKWRRQRPTWTEVGGLAVGVIGLVIAMVAIVVPLLTNNGSPASGRNRPANLVVDSFTARDFSMGPHPNTHLEILLHNTGGTLAVVDRATVHVEHVFALRRCASQDDIPLSETYGLVLPHNTSQTDSHVLNLHDQVKPDGTDRFAISISTRLSRKSPATYFLFRLAVELSSDGPESPLKVGTALIALPTIPDQGEYYWTPTTVELLREFQTEGQTVSEFWGESMPCWRRNTAILRRALRPDAVRSAKVDAIAREMITPSFRKLE